MSLEKDRLGGIGMAIGRSIPSTPPHVRYPRAMCVFCYNPGLAIGEITLVAGPIAGAVVQRIKSTLGLATPSEEAQSEPTRTHTSDTAETTAPAAAAMNAAG